MRHSTHILQTETYQVKPGEPTHGYSGPLKVSMGGTFTNVGKEFLDVAAKYDKRRGSMDDLNALFKCDVYGVRSVPSHSLALE